MTVIIVGINDGNKSICEFYYEFWLTECDDELLFFLRHLNSHSLTGIYKLRLPWTWNVDGCATTWLKWRSV
jgi:hypothetical protein